MQGTKAITKEEPVYQSWSLTNVTAPKTHGACLCCSVFGRSSEGEDLTEVEQRFGVYTWELSFPVCKMGITMVMVSWDCWKVYMRCSPKKVLGT